MAPRSSALAIRTVPARLVKYMPPVNGNFDILET